MVLIGYQSLEWVKVKQQNPSFWKSQLNEAVIISHSYKDTSQATGSGAELVAPGYKLGATLSE